MSKENGKIKEIEDDPFDCSAIKHMLQIYKDDIITIDSNRSKKKGKYQVTQKRINRIDTSDNYKKKKVDFKSPLIEIINVESFKLWTRKMYILPCHDRMKYKETCCEEYMCNII